MVKPVVICHLYPRNMNIYGDTGNVRALEYRLQQRHNPVRIVTCEVGQNIPTDVDIIVAGGGQDRGQLVVEKDLLKKQRNLKALIGDGVVVLAICGTYQLLGHRFITLDAKHLRGIGVFDMETQGTVDRLIGNIVIDSPFGELVGFENHSGKTFLGAEQAALGRVKKGAGNNGVSKDEGAVVHNCFGSYLHGPLLPKNPVFADELLVRALNRKYGKSIPLDPLSDTEELQAAALAKTRPR